MNKFKIIYLSIIVVVLIATPIICEGDVESSRPSRLQVLSELTQKTIPFLTMDDYLRYAMNLDFSYDVITLFSLKNTAGGRCQMCETAFKGLKVLGKALRKKERPIFVIGVDLETEKQLALMLGVERMPLVHIRSVIHNLDEFYPMNQHLEVQLLQKWILTKTGVEVKIKVPTDYKRIVGMVVWTLVLLFLLFLVYKYLRQYIGKNLIAMAGVYICVIYTAGMEYCYINNSPYVIQNANGEIEPLGHGQRDQTVTECYIITGLYMAMIVSFLILMEIKFVVTWRIFPKSLSMNKRRWIVTLGAFYCLLYTFSYIIVLIRHKMGGSYPYSFMLNIV